MNVRALIFEQVLDIKLFFLQVIDSEKLKFLLCFENIVVGAHHSLYRNYFMKTDLTNL